MENKELLCQNCLLGESKRSRTMICNLNPEPKDVKATHFCGQGIWMLDGKTMDFKEAWTYINEEKTME